MLNSNKHNNNAQKPPARDTKQTKQEQYHVHCLRTVSSKTTEKFNLFLHCGFCHPYRLNEFISSLRGVWCIFFIFILFFIEIVVSKQWRPWTDAAAFCGAWSGSAPKVPKMERQAHMGWVKRFYCALVFTLGCDVVLQTDNYCSPIPSTNNPRQTYNSKLNNSNKRFNIFSKEWVVGSHIITFFVSLLQEIL